MTYVSMDYDGLQETIMRLLSGEAIPVDVEGFENDFESFRTKDDVLTLLIHLGYLTWDGKKGVAKIPNEEQATRHIFPYKSPSFIIIPTLI